MRVWDSTTGTMLPSSDERTAIEQQRAEKEKRRAEKEKRRAETSESLLDDTRKLLDEEGESRRRMAQELRELGIDPDSV